MTLSRAGNFFLMSTPGKDPEAIVMTQKRKLLDDGTRMFSCD